MQCKLIRFTVEGSGPFPFAVMAAERAAFADPGELHDIHIVEMFEVSRPGKRQPEMRPKNRRIALIKVTVARPPREKVDAAHGLPNVRLWEAHGYRVDRGSIKPYVP